MNALNIEPSDFSPKVILDPVKNIFVLSGESRPENTSKFYIPILQWLEQYQGVLYWEKDKFGKGEAKTFEFKFEYFNSTSAKFIMDVLMQLDKMALEGYNILAKWYYDKHDEDMKESGEEFSKLLKKLPIEFIEV
jgi:SiaC family regulatory phosphoprotein